MKAHSSFNLECAFLSGSSGFPNLSHCVKTALEWGRARSDPMQDQMKDKIVVITGANGGLGQAMTERCLQAKAKVVLLCRRQSAALCALSDIASRGVDTEQAIIKTLDLEDIEQTRAMAKELVAEFPKIDLLLLNAGVFRLPPQLNAAGLERHFAINYLGHYLLCAGVWPALVAAPAARIVGVNSATERKYSSGFLDPRSLEGKSPWKNYAFSKRCLLSFGRELDARARAVGLPCRFVAADPGFVGTSLLSANGPKDSFWDKARNRFFAVNGTWLGQSPMQGSRSLWFASTQALAPHDVLVQPKGPGALWGEPGWAKPSRGSIEPNFVRELWEFSQSYAPFDPAAAKVA